MVWPWATALYGLVLSTRVPDAEYAGSRANSKLQVFHQLLHSLFTELFRVCSRHASVLQDNWKNTLQNGLFHTVYDGGLGHIFIHISCLTHKKEENM